MGFSTCLGQFRSHKRASSTIATSGRTSSTKNSRTWRNQASKASKDTKLNSISNPGGHKKECASFPNQSSYKDSKIHSLDHLLEKRERNEHREERRGGRQGEGARICSLGKQHPSLLASPAFLSSKSPSKD